MRSFGSDNNSGVHPDIMHAIVESNCNHAVGYGGDRWTERAKEAMRKLLGEESIHPYFVLNGTGANVVALQACVSSFHSIVCASTAHIAVDECGAPTKFTGCALKEIATSNGKLTPDLVIDALHGFGDAHHSQPKVIAISQTTELGTVYSLEEIRALADVAHRHDMFLFMDGARLANACAAVGCSLREMTIESGVDIFTFGGTKNGLMMGEVVVAVQPELERNIQYFRKQACQLYSKMRYISAQFIPYIEDNLWLENARKSNQAAQLLYSKLKQFENVEITQDVDSNALFFILDREVANELRKHYFFYDWNTSRNEVRLVCSWDTSEEDIENFIDRLATLTN